MKREELRALRRAELIDLVLDLQEEIRRLEARLNEVSFQALKEAPPADASTAERIRWQQAHSGWKIRG